MEYVMSESTSATFSFSYKSWWDHTAAVFSRPGGLLVAVTGIFGASWGLLEATIAGFSLNPDRLFLYVAVAAVSLVLAIAWRFRDYLETCPEGLGELSPATRRIAHLQRPKWEFQFTKAVLAQVLGPADRECRDILDGRVFVPATPFSGFREYLAWMSSRNTNTTRMLEIAQLLLMVELPRVITSAQGKPADPREILAVAHSIRRLYQGAVDFEKATLAVEPPEGCERLHAFSIGWTAPIREAVLQLFGFLKQVCEVDTSADTHISFTFVFPECPNMVAHADELERLEDKLPEILAQEW